MKCALCGRQMESATVMIGALAVGPTCARKAGLIELGRKRQGAIRLALPQPKVRNPYNGDLFEELDNGADQGSL